jgi:hypothetical protein
MNKLEVELKLTVEKIDMILAHLAKGAYQEVADLIAHIRGQALPQVQAANTAPAAEPAPEAAAEAPAAQ